MLYLTQPLYYTTLIKLWTQEFRRLSGSNKWKKLKFEIVLVCTRSGKHFQHMDTISQKTLTLNFYHFQTLLHTTPVSLTLNMDFASIGLKTYMIETNWSTRVLKKIKWSSWKWWLDYGCTSIRRTTTCLKRFVDSKSIYSWYITITVLSDETTKSTKANRSHWQPNFATAIDNTRRTHKDSPTINKLTFKKEKQILYFPMNLE